MSTTWPVVPTRFPPRSAFAELLRTEWLLVLRQRKGLIAGLGLPVLLLVIFGSIPGFNKPQRVLDGFTYLDAYLPVLIAMIMNNLGLICMPTLLASYRETGILRRLSTTPLPPSWVLGAQLIINFFVAAVSILVVMIVGGAAFSLRLPQDPGAFVLSSLLTIAALFALGLWIAAAARTSKAAGWIGGSLFYPLMFFAGLWVPQPVMPAALRHASEFTPLGASVQALARAIVGQFPSASSLLLMAGYAAVFGTLAIRSFKWE
jgi:ABC-2 type transport system permease protein